MQKGSKAANGLRRIPVGAKRQQQKKIRRHVCYTATDTRRFRHAEDQKEVRSGMCSKTATLPWQNAVSRSSHSLASLIAFRVTATEHGEHFLAWRHYRLVMLAAVIVRLFPLHCYRARRCHENCYRAFLSSDGPRRVCTDTDNCE